MVKNRRQDKANESPYATKETDVSPGASRCDQLAVEHTRAERKDGENQDCHVRAALAGWGQFRGDSKRSQLVDAGSSTSNRHTSDESVHRMSRGGDDVAEDEEEGTKESNIATSK